MFKKTSKILAVVVVLTMIVSLTMQSVSAAAAKPGADIQWTNVGQVNMKLDLTQSKIHISITVLGSAGTTFKDGKVVLKKNNDVVKEWTGISSNSPILQFSDSSVTRSKGTYKLTLTVTAVKNGVSEKITQTKEATY